MSPLDFKRYSVLFVDDEEGNREVFQASFEPDFRVICASSGEEGLEVMRREPGVAILITDQRMPGMSGVDLVKLVRQEFPFVVRMIVTAYSDLKSAVDAINLGHVSRYISKPWDIAEVRTLLGEALERFDLNLQVRELQAQVLKAERLSTLGLAAGSIAHDVGRPLGLLFNCLDEVEHDMGKTAAELADVQGVPEASFNRLQGNLEVFGTCREGLEQIEGILKEVRISYGVQTEQEPVHLEAVVQTALTMIKTEVSRQASLRVECDPEVWVMGEGPPLVQVVINLVVNAANAITTGRAVDNEILLQVTSQGEMALLVVQDTGCGIPHGQQELMWDTLYTTRAEQGGTGLGLSIVRRVIRRLDGQILLESTEGVGTRFTIMLPLHRH